LRILVANFFPAFHPPGSGGEQRYYYFYRHLSRYFDVTLLSPTFSGHAFEEVRFSKTLRELRVPKQDVFDRLHWELDKTGIGPECSGYVVALASRLENEYARRFAAEAIDADIIVHECPFTLPYDRSLGFDGKIRIYNAYNVEHRLAQQMLLGEAGRSASEFIRFLESALARNAALIFATSEEDRRLLAADFEIDVQRIVLAPNGFEPPGDSGDEFPRRQREAYVVFMGSAHPPNVEAGRFIVEQLAPAMPGVEFRILGAVCGKLRDEGSHNVRLLGFIEESAKRAQLEGCAAAINPLFSGSGTNLKMLDYLAAGAPVVTTVVGARGLSLVDNVTAFIAGIERFAERLTSVLEDGPLRGRVAEAGRRKAYAEFTWKSIADHAYESIRKLIAKQPVAETGADSRASLLVVNDFPVAQAAGGGEVRIRELLTELGRDFEVSLLCLSQDLHPTERMLSPSVREIRIPKTSEHRDAEVRAGRNGVVSVNDVLAAQFCNSNEAFVAAYRRLAARSSAVVFEHPYLSPLVEFLPSDKPVVYSALNVERTLKPQLLRDRKDSAKWLEKVEALERALLTRANLVICVSHEDRSDFQKEFRATPITVVENGVRVASRQWVAPFERPAVYEDPGQALAVFVGSAHAPNIDAARFLIQVVAPAIPSVAFAILGSVCAGVGMLPIPDNVALLGLLSETEKNALFERAHVALNPLFQGGGSSLKVPDYFASGLPLVSTRTGVRGYRLVDGEHFLEADRSTFVKMTLEIVRNRELRDRLSRNARRYAETALDWAAIGQRYRRAMHELVAGRRVPRALVVTYRFADPPPGGAETYMVNVLRELGKRGNVRIDVATCDVDTIVDKWHFSASYTGDKQHRETPSYLDAVYRFPVNPPNPGDFAQCRKLFSMWMAETRQQAIGWVDVVEPPALLGGWNFPESGGGKVRRWTSQESQLRVPGTTQAIRVTGYAPHRIGIELRCGSRVVAARVVDGPFRWEAEFRDTGGVLAFRTDRCYEADGDSRELGFAVGELSFSDGARWHPVDLAVDFESIARRVDGARWVGSLVNLTRRRNPMDDEIFVAVRGPNSSGLDAWLASNLASYDVVLAQGTPFATPVVVTDVALRVGVPVVLLPHFHMEDRYYHWQRYYDAFRKADQVIAAPESVKKMFFDAIDASSVSVPGGGIEPGEFAEDRLARAERAFQAVHDGVGPFVLVLGRKTGAKNYRMAVDAVSSLNQSRHRVDLVLIGPDEDGLKVEGAGTYCYGAQSRDVVVGALKRSLCLVNMSESESFGIVLLEAWLAGRPVIANRTCIAFSDLVQSGRNGFLVGTAVELAEAIDAYLTNEDLAAKHAAEGRPFAERHAWSRVAEQIEGILLEAAKQSAPAMTESAEGSREAPLGSR
jgi:glycosyltransferase involved in cell wall biosynthesis